MTTPSTPGTELAERARLFAPGQRLGWTFRDRNQFPQPFTEPAPQPQPVPERLERAAHEAHQRHGRLICVMATISGKIFVLSIVLGVAWAILDSIFGLLPPKAQDAFKGFGVAVLSPLLVVGVIAIGLGAVSIVRSKLVLSGTVNAVAHVRQDLEAAHQRETDDWQRRKTIYEQAEETRIDQLPEWGAVQTPAGSRRLDIFGGNLWAWQAFLTVCGTSALAARPVIVVDLSREMVCKKLMSTARDAGFPVDVQMLPDHFAHTTLLSGLAGQHIVDTLIESMHGDNPATAREERSMDNRILTTLCDTLGDDLSLGRIAAGLRALLDQPDATGYLTTKERDHIADELFPTQYRQHAQDRLHRLESYIQPLEKLGTTRVDSDPAYLTCMALASEGHNVRAELLTDLIVQWLTHRIVTQATDTPQVIIAGADTIALRHLERLCDACEYRNIHLTLLFRHLRDTAVNFIGGGVAGFMKMSNHIEATHAADFIGRHHKFVSSQITKTLGGNETHTDTDTDGESYTLSTNRSTTHNWSVSRTDSEGTNWSDAQTHQRVHEYTVDPTELQHLPDHAMILITTQPGTQPHLIPVKFDPTMITLPRVSTDPHPQLPLLTPQPTTSPTPDTTTLTYHHTTHHKPM